MPSEPPPHARHSNLPLEVLLAMDVDVGWRVGLTTRPGQDPPPDAFAMSDTEDVSAAFEADFALLVSDPAGLNEFKQTVANAIVVRLREVSTEFYIQEFGSAFYRISICWDCADKPDCPLCAKTGYVTEIFRPHLVGLCTLKGVHERLEVPGPSASPLVPEPEPEPMPMPLTAALPPSALVRPAGRHWLLWTVPVAALATVAMAVSIGLRSMIGTETSRAPPPAQVHPVAAPAPLPAAPPELPAPPAAPSAGPVLPPAPVPLAVPETSAPLPRPPVAPPAFRSPAEPAVDAQAGAPRRKPGPSVTPEAPPSVQTPTVDKNWPVIRLQTALTQLGLYHGAVSGVLDEPTRQSLAAFVAMVPPPIKAQYGTRVAAMAEAAVRHEFPIRAR